MKTNPTPMRHGNRYMQPSEKPKNMKVTLKRLWQLFGNEQKRFYLIFILIFGSAVLGMTYPYLIGQGIDAIFVSSNGLVIVITSLFIAYVIDATLTFIQAWMMAGISQRITKKIREALFSKLHTLSIPYFDTHSKGDLMSRLANDVDNISTTLSSSLTQLIQSSIMIIGAFTMMIVLSPLLTIASLISIPLVFGLTKMIAKNTRVYFKEQQIELGKLNGHIEESITGFEAVKAFSKEDALVTSFNEINERLYKVGVRAQIWSGFLMPIMNVINNLSFTIIATIGGILALKGMITIGVIASFVSYSKQFVRPLNDIANIFNTLQSALSSAERVFELLDEEEETDDIPNAKTATKQTGDVAFNHVSFGYREDVSILTNLNFHIEAGMTVALVGPTGAGKTTIVNLLTRFYDTSDGEILLDNVNIKHYTRESLRQCFGTVLQDTYLFTGTIRENIRYGRLEATDEEVEQAARKANAHSFIRRLPQGYETILLESGSNVSQGQQQLLAIARAILTNPTILILDEATSNVDTRTELAIQEAMIELMNGRTSFIIAHRLSTIQDADLIMVVKDGNIFEAGNHEELLLKKGFYYELFMSQFIAG